MAYIHTFSKIEFHTFPKKGKKKEFHAFINAFSQKQKINKSMHTILEISYIHFLKKFYAFIYLHFQKISQKKS